MAVTATTDQFLCHRAGWPREAVQILDDDTDPGERVRPPPHASLLGLHPAHNTDQGSGNHSACDRPEKGALPYGGVPSGCDFRKVHQFVLSPGDSAIGGR